jgi:hypothetical protein
MSQDEIRKWFRQLDAREQGAWVDAWAMGEVTAELVERTIRPDRRTSALSGLAGGVVTMWAWKTDTATIWYLLSEGLRAVLDDELKRRRPGQGHAGAGSEIGHLRST